jgi:iron complex outermembrane recepter protein
MQHFRLSAGAALIAAAFHTGALAEEANPASQFEVPSVDVVGTTPLPGIGTPINEVPANVTAVTNAQIEQQQSVSVPDFLERNLGSVNVNEPGGNPFQPTVNFRGFQGSPLLGQPQGLSAFQDGVRVNEAIGDVINWDLIPLGAISSMTMIPGSNPVFGLNTLGGALSINTKSGREFPGGQATLYGGSFGTYNGSFEYGGSQDKFDYYVYGNYYDSDGWRDYSSSLIRQVFGKVGYQTSDFDADLSYAFANNSLNGTQASPLPLLDADPKQAYTWPDTTDNKVNFANLRLSKVLSSDKILAGNVYWRQFKTRNIGSNVSDDFGGANDGATCDFTLPVGEQCPATNDASDITTDGTGGTLQFTWLAPLGSRDNRLTIGASYDHGDTRFTQSAQDAVFSAAREAVGVTPFTTETRVASTTAYTGLFITDTFSLTRQLLLTLSGRYNSAKIDINDELGNKPAVTGSNSFNRFNPAVGLNFNPDPAVNTYVTYNEGMRAPTAVELTCADPNAPCPLPNAFLADPPLEPVIAKTIEVGGRGAFNAAGTSWSAALYRTKLSNDIQFVSSGGGGNVGYFQNIPQTRRQGFELGLQQRLGPVTLSGAYGFIDATYQSSFAINSPNNSSSDPATGDIQVTSGARIAGIARNNFKLRVDWEATPALSLGAALIYASSQYAQGDENNQDQNGQVPGYTIVNLDGRYRLTDRWQIFGRINNVFNTRYETAGALGADFFRGASFTYDAAAAQPEQFRTPGAPFGVWVGVSYSFGKSAASAPRDN